MLIREKDTITKLNTLGISSEVDGVLLYVTDEAAELYTLSTWWINKSGRILDSM